MDTPQINTSDIRKKEIRDFVPEVYKLKQVIENNPWHNKESVFDHTISVLDNLDKIIKKSKKEIKKYLNVIVDNNSRRSLLYFAALLHDIGKEKTIADLGDGFRGCPGHEENSGQRTKKILKRFNLSNKESKIITSIVKNHGVTHDIIGLDYSDFKKNLGKDSNLTHSVVGLENKDFKKEYINFKNEFSEIYVELILLGFADTIGSYLKKTRPNEFRHRINFYKKELESLPNLE